MKDKQNEYKKDKKIKRRHDCGVWCILRNGDMMESHSNSDKSNERDIKNRTMVQHNKQDTTLTTQRA